MATTPKPGPYDVGPLMTVSGIGWGGGLWLLVTTATTTIAGPAWIDLDGTVCNSADGTPFPGSEFFSGTYSNSDGSIVWDPATPEASVRSFPVLSDLVAFESFDLVANIPVNIGTPPPSDLYRGASTQDRLSITPIDPVPAVRTFANYLSFAAYNINELRTTVYRNDGIAPSSPMPFAGSAGRYLLCEAQP